MQLNYKKKLENYFEINNICAEITMVQTHQAQNIKDPVRRITAGLLILQDMTMTLKKILTLNI